MITLQLKQPIGKLKLLRLEPRASQKTTIPPRQQVFVPVKAEKDIDTVIGTVEAFPAFERKTELQVSVSIDVRDTRTTELCPDYQLPGPHDYNAPKQDNYSIQKTDSKSSQKGLSNGERTTYPGL